MISIIDVTSLSSHTTSWVNLLLDIALKGIVVMLATSLLIRLWRGASAATRHLAWSLALTSLLAMPVLSLVLPAWQVSILPEMLSASRAATALAYEPAPGEAKSQAGSDPLPGSGEARRVRDRGQAFSPVARPAERAGTEGETAATPIAEKGQTGAAAPHWSLIALAVWAVGALAVLARVFVGTVSVWWITRQAEAVTTGEWAAVTHALSLRLGLTRGVRLLKSSRVTMPMTCGLLRSSVLLPADADEWSRERRQVVLLHELAHAKRMDCLTQMLAQAACALYWFNPLTWVAARKLRMERERACDDLVLDSGTKASDYAGHLLDLARSLGEKRCPSFAAVAIAKPSQLEGRLLAILDPRQSRRGLNRLATALTSLLVASLVLPLAAMRPLAQAKEPAGGQKKSEMSVRAKSAEGAVTVQSSAVGKAVHAGRKADPEPSDATTSAASQAQPAIEPNDPGDHDFEFEFESPTPNPNPNPNPNPARVSVWFSKVNQSATTDGQRDNSRIIEALKEAMKDEDAEVRMQAASALGQAGGSAALDVLSAAINDKSWQIRKQAVHAMGLRGSANVIEPLIAALKDPHPEVREQAAWGLGLKGDGRAIEPLIDSLKDENANVREQAAWALGLKGNERAVDGLINALKDSDASVREQAAWALGLKGNRRSVEPLIDALKDADPSVRKQAAWALGLKGDARAADALSAALKDPNRQVREQAASALGMILIRSPQQ